MYYGIINNADDNIHKAQLQKKLNLDKINWMSLK